MTKSMLYFMYTSYVNACILARLCSVSGGLDLWIVMDLTLGWSGFRISLLQIAPGVPFLWGGCRPPTPPGLQWGGSAPPHPSKMSAFGLRNVGLRPPWAQGPRWAPNQDSPGSYLGPGWVSEKSENENGPQRVQNGSIRAETLSI